MLHGLGWAGRRFALLTLVWRRLMASAAAFALLLGAALLAAAAFFASGAGVQLSQRWFAP